MRSSRVIDLPVYFRDGIPYQRLHGRGLQCGPLLARALGQQARRTAEDAPWSSIVRPGDQVLEIGAGTGALSLRLLALAPSQLTLVEPQAELIRVLSARLARALEQGSGSAPGARLRFEQRPFEQVRVDERQDVVISAHSWLSHYPRASERQLLLRRMATALRPGGLLVLQEPARDHAATRDASFGEPVTERLSGGGARLERVSWTESLSKNLRVSFDRVRDLDRGGTENYFSLRYIGEPDELLKQAAIEGLWLRRSIPAEEGELLVLERG